ncbi:MAG: hypothetical protein KDA93_18695 [Planctomycetaceae bacterium]|nr:hypothetical protein [Planctomycetaceae bacterium]
MSKFGPILVILLAMLSIGFMGFAGVGTFGGPNWSAMANSMKDYQITQNTGADTTWTAVSSNDESLKTSSVLPEVIVAALDHKTGVVQAELNELNEEEQTIQQNRESLNSQIEVDKVSLDTYRDRQAQLLVSLGEQVAALSRQAVQKTDQASAIEKEVEDRRSDVFRQQNQLEVLRADQARIGQISQQMIDLIEQIDADLEKARRREKQLRQQLGEDY